MLKFIERCDCDILKTREIYNTANDPLRFQFDSARKRMSTVLDLPDGESSEHGYAKRLHVKGASEIILKTCSHYLNADGQKTLLDDVMK
jgi:Ca2+-transporting ATPase